MCPATLVVGMLNARGVPRLETVPRSGQTSVNASFRRSAAAARMLQPEANAPHVVLVGGGHAHVQVMLLLATSPPPPRFDNSIIIVPSHRLPQDKSYINIRL